MAEPICFVIGAGASVDYQLPTGGGLRNQLIGQGMPVSLRGRPGFGGSADKDKYEEFQQAFKLSGIESIDRFLANRPEFANIGKPSIAAVIGQAEGDAQDHFHTGWIQYLYNRFVARWGGVENWQAKFVTFNYDMVLESALATMVSHTTNIQINEAWEKVISNVPIHHVYGSLEGIPRFCTDTNRCVLKGFTRAPEKEAAGIKVIGEDRPADEVDSIAQEYIDSSSTIVFLGFGFDIDNCMRIGLGPRNKYNKLESPKKRWVTTAVDKIGKEREHIKSMLVREPVIAMGSDDRESGSCQMVLRQFLSL